MKNIIETYKWLYESFIHSVDNFSETEEKKRMDNSWKIETEEDIANFLLKYGQQTYLNEYKVFRFPNDKCVELTADDYLHCNPTGNENLPYVYNDDGEEERFVQGDEDSGYYFYRIRLEVDETGKHLFENQINIECNLDYIYFCGFDEWVDYERLSEKNKREVKQLLMDFLCSK